MSLRARLGVALGVTALVSVIVTALVSAGLLRTFTAAQARDDLRRLARAVAADPFGDVATADLTQLRTVLRVSGDELALVRGDGTILAVSATAAQVARAVGPAGGLGAEDEGTVEVGGTEYAYIAVPIVPRFPAGPRAGGAVVIARPLSLTTTALAPMVGRIALAALGATLLAFAASSWLASRLARPVRDLSGAAQRIARGDLAQRVPVEGNDELAELAASFNAMSAALSEAQRREREFLASVSHELRTPITAIKGYAEALQEDAIAPGEGRDDALRIIQEETDRLERMVRDVMDLARLGARNFALEVRPVDLASTLRDTAATYRVQAGEAGITLDDDVPDELPVTTDPDRVKQIVSNLVENALRVTDDGGRVRIGAAPAAGGAVIDVADTGPGIAAEDLPHVFERSYLWRTSKGTRPVGTGLGLAIVRELVAALGGTVEVASEAGRGTTFRVALPPAHAREASADDA